MAVIRHSRRGQGCERRALAGPDVTLVIPTHPRVPPIHGDGPSVQTWTCGDLSTLYADRKLMTPEMIARLATQFHLPEERTEKHMSRCMQTNARA